jgi:hypothetical protein
MEASEALAVLTADPHLGETLGRTEPDADGDRAPVWIWCIANVRVDVDEGFPVPRDGERQLAAAAGAVAFTVNKYRDEIKASAAHRRRTTTGGWR